MIVESNNKYNKQYTIIEQDSLIHFCDYILSLYFITKIYDKVNK